MDKRLYGILLPLHLGIRPALYISTSQVLGWKGVICQVAPVVKSLLPSCWSACVSRAHSVSGEWCVLLSTATGVHLFWDICIGSRDAYPATRCNPWSEVILVLSCQNDTKPCSHRRVSVGSDSLVPKDRDGGFNQICQELLYIFHVRGNPRSRPREALRQIAVARPRLSLAVPVAFL